MSMNKKLDVWCRNAKIDIVVLFDGDMLNGALLDVRVNMNGKQYLLDKLLEFENYEEMTK